MRRPLAAVLVSLALAACGGHSGAPAQAAPRVEPPLRYGPGTGRYRVELSLSVAQEQMGQAINIQGGANMVISAALAPADSGNLAAAITVDSVTATSTQPEQRAALEASRGRTYRGVYSTRGRMISYGPPDSTAARLRDGGELFREFLPELPVGTATPGDSWTDTSVTTQNLPQGLHLEIRAIRQHHVIGWEQREAGRALHLNTTASYTITGSGTTQGQQLAASGNGAASVERFVSPAGVYLGGTESDSTNMTITVVQMGMDIPIHQVRRGSLTRLP